ANGHATVLDSLPQNEDAGGYATVCIGGMMNFDNKSFGQDTQTALLPLAGVFDGDINMAFCGGGITPDSEHLLEIKNAGIDLLSVATRYTSPRAQEFTEIGQIDCIGAKNSPSYLTQAGGISIGIIAAYGYEVEGSQAFCFNCLSPDGASAVIGEISSLRSQGAHYIIVAVDWGNSTSEESTPEMHAIASELCANGADLVIGTGSFFIQSARHIIDENSSVEADDHHLVAYSVGYLTSEYVGTGLSGGSYIAKITIVRPSDGDKTYAKQMQYIPVFRYKSEGKVMIFPSTTENHQNVGKILPPLSFSRYNSFTSALQDKLGIIMTPVFEQPESDSGEKITL
ncbi:MAG: CapA family protein, partial [Clostridia bacterium]|nr:CapA family protein [Clostridia bacterium]